MNGGTPGLGTDDLLVLLEALSDHLQTQGVAAQLFVVGGAAMALGYDVRRTTRDVDAVFEPTGVVRAAAAALGETHGLEPDWLNDAAKGFMPGPDDERVVVFESRSLLVEVASPRYLLAMKVFASRDETDLNDAAALCEIVGIHSRLEILDVLTTHYPAERLLPRHEYVLEEVVDRLLRRGTPAYPLKQLRPPGLVPPETPPPPRPPNRPLV